jgi:CRISPR-associated protein Cmr1
MAELELHLQLVTPLFLGGANSRGGPELRAPPIRGELRYWLRAMLGARGVLDLGALRSAEARVFGDTNVGSPVSVRVSDLSEQGMPIDSRRMLPHRRLPDSPSRRPGPPPKNPSPRPAFVEGAGFDLTLATRPGHSSFPDGALQALVLWLYLGGLGKRARRGFGSLRVASVIAATDLPADVRGILDAEVPADGASLADRVSTALTWALAGAKEVRDIPPFPTLAPKQSGIIVCRRPLQPLNNGEPYEEAMRVFWNEHLRSPGLRDPRAYGYAEGTSRRASPIHVHMARSGRGYHLVLTGLRSEPSPAGEEGWSMVNDLLDSCCDKLDGQEVWPPAAGGAT